MRPNIVVLGECMIELSPTQSADTLRVGFAGDTFNTAWYLAHLWGQAGRVHYATRIGTDETSAAFRSFAASSGISTNLMDTHPNRGMGLYMIHLKNGERSFSYWRDASAAKTMADDPTALARVMDAADNIYLSGISVAILSPEGREHLAAALTAARAAGKRVFFDTNLRAKLWQDPKEMTRETARFASCADVVLPSFDDEATHFGHATIQATAAHYHQLSADLVVVKNAGKDVLVSRKEGAEIVPQDRIEAPVDTTAAGDSFNAGFLAEYLMSGDALVAVQRGTALARRVIMGPGALVQAAVDPVP